ncbi:MAG: serine hydrolase domain-containing protein [Bacteroidota bacterium]
MRQFFICCLLVVWTCVVLPAQTTDITKSGFSAERLARYEQFLQGEIDENRLAGAVSYVVRKGEVAHRGALGYSNLAEKTPMTEDKIFHLMSMTKPIVSVAFMMLYEEGHFELFDKVEDYLPEFKNLRVSLDPSKGPDGETEAIKEPVRIIHLLNHTAGFSHGLSGTKLDNELAKALYYSPQENIETRVATLASMPLVGHPGEQWFYSASPDVLALLIEKFSGMTAEAFLQKRIFGPLEMNDTGYNIPDNKIGRQTYLHGYDKAGKFGNQPGAPVQQNTVFGGTHGLLSTAADYAKFAQMLLNGGAWEGKRYLSRKTLELMTLNHVGDLRGNGEGFGLGFGVVTDLAKTQQLGSVGRFHWSGAYCTYFFVDPKEELVAILLTQTAPYNDDLRRKFQQLIYQAIAD